MALKSYLLLYFCQNSLYIDYFGDKFVIVGQSFYNHHDLTDAYVGHIVNHYYLLSRSLSIQMIIVSLSFFIGHLINLYFVTIN